MDRKITQNGIAGTQDRIEGICAGNRQAIMIQEKVIMPVGVAYWTFQVLNAKVLKQHVLPISPVVTAFKVGILGAGCV
jgi:hypothetical protein